MKTSTSAATVARIPAGATVVVAPACGTPTSLLATLADEAGPRGVTLLAGLLLDPEVLLPALDRGALRLRTWHPTAALAHQLDQGTAEYIPLRASAVPSQLRAWSPDVAMVRVSPPDRHGWCSLGASAGYARAALATAGTRIAEIDPAVPHTFGDTPVHLSCFDAVTESTTPMPVHPPARQTEVTRAIAGHVLELLPSKPTLQLGIGTVPEALLGALADAELGGLRFVGMGSDGMADLFERGLLDLDLGRAGPAISTPDILGTRRVMDFADGNPAVGVFESATAHTPALLAHHDRLVSVNSAIEVDVSGQVNAELVRGRRISGVGGSIDFVEAATHSPGGLRIIALPSTTPDGTTSRIVARLAESTPTSLPKAMVDVVVTEHGVARLAGLSMRERAESLANIAAPQHRETIAAGKADLR
ncbi:acetyl-CoA hydrolase/transferase family protein [Streptomyces fuscichromogenes]|uniref:4-hydroxybutyrate CoA-transferase n=1 Tax=Streptomyces fuscichromogenes TaxID=1324013 RepID=A0A918CQ30_9ACTN|nr:acetyl-CoA hydrolase/transferase C-terminal domain-containing protein [Streptomyces fuscichromogenes]GGM98054.1 4-hydroxybutyrate CoA-transferase [Streptomyces fuscichromogenes]